ncbi:MAG: Pyrimidine 5'-nucleotidase (UMPH-1) [archaeon ADurb.Bin336]|nr:MAG: Pyrimidine 5'-nucleotidase (UMPH-1) [archaeon ADurb.Bin336]
MKEKVIISNPKEFEEKKKVFITAGAKQVRIVTDFDRTLSKAFDKKKKIHTIIAQIREGNYLSEDYTKKAFELHAKYYPIEMSTTIPLKEKKKQMMNWWGTHIKYLAKSGMNKKIVKDVAKNKIILRKNTLEFFEMIKKKKIPLLILSAALGDVIEEILKINKINYKGIHTISNFFEFDKKGNVLGYKGKIIHSLNKNEFEIKDTTFYKKIKDRKNILLLGDTLDDLQMVEGIKYNEIIQIGFLNNNIEENLEQYKKAYDVVILNDGSMNFVNKLLKQIK